MGSKVFNSSWAVGIMIPALLLSGCKESPSTSKVDELGRANAPASSPAPESVSAPVRDPSVSVSSGKVHRGIIVEAKDVANYTYVKFKDKEGLEHWAAVLKGQFEIGADVAIVESIVMKNFTSPTLNRTFDSIIFGNVDGAPPAEAPVDGAAALPPGHPPIQLDTASLPDSDK
ncbi:MAG: hypothetical protein JXR76_15110 [Deltaproteobacteria bacterium]|nr:hypothetical protein [Deltaproteobacteria bacterium]